MALQAHAQFAIRVPALGTAGRQPARMEVAPAKQAIFLGPQLHTHGSPKVEQGKSFVPDLMGSI